MSTKSKCLAWIVSHVSLMCFFSDKAIVAALALLFGLLCFLIAFKHAPFFKFPGNQHKRSQQRSGEYLASSSIIQSEFKFHWSSEQLSRQFPSSFPPAV